MAESNLCELRGKKPANRRASLFQQCRQSPLETILTQTVLFPAPSQQLKRLNHNPQWRVGSFGG
jgi:hypothetical protein